MNNLLNLRKRDWVFVMSPKDFDFSACKCGNKDLSWSEYKGAVWCDKCKIDFIPKHAGILDGPVMIEVCRLMGITFDSFDLKSNQRVEFGAETWPYSEKR